MQDSAGIGAVGLMDVLRGMIRRRKKLVLLSTILFAGLGLLVIMLSSPVYTAISQVIVEYEDTPYTRSSGAAGIAAPRQITERDVRSQVEVIRSSDLALKVLRRLHLVGTPEFDPLKRGLGPLRRLKIALGFVPDPRRQTPEQRALAVWDRKLKVYSLPGTKVIVMEFNSSSPKTAATIANTLAELYVEQTRATRLSRTSEAREWLKEQIEKLRTKVVQAEKAVENFRAKAGLFQGERTKLYNQELSALSAQIVRAAAERSQAEAKAKAIRRLLKKGEVEKSADVLRSRLIQRLREQQVQIRRRLAELSTVYLDNHPRVKAVRKELADLKRQIRNEARKIAESLEEQARIAAAREAELRARQAKMKAQVSAASQDEVKLRELEREAKAQRSLLESFLARYTDALTREDKQALPGMARIIARAWEPAAPSFPKPGPIMLLSTLAGLVLGLGMAFVLEVMAAVRQGEAAAMAGTAATQAGAAAAAAVAGQPDDGVQKGHVSHDATDAAAIDNEKAYIAGADAARQAMASAVVGQPSADDNGNDLLHDNAAGPMAAMHADAGQRNAAQVDAGRLDAEEVGLRMAAAAARRAEQFHEEADVQRIACVSVGLSRDVMANVLLATARKLAVHHRVILLDAASGQHRLPSQGDNEPGLRELLAGSARFADVVEQDAQQPQLHGIAAGQGEIPGELLQGEAMHRLLRALAENYDIVLLNEGEPRYPLHATRSILPLAEATLILHDADMQELVQGLAAAIRNIDGMRVALIPSDVMAAEEGETAQPQAGKTGTAASGSTGI